MSSLQDIQKEMDDLFQNQDQMTSLEYLTKSNELKRKYETFKNNDNYKIYTNNLNIILSYADYRPRVRYFSDEYVEIRYIRNTITHLE
jgi:hypothetical protein